LDDHPATDLASVTDTNAGMEQGMITDRDVRSDVDVGDEPAMVADPAVRTDPAKRTDRGVLADAGGRINHRPWMDPRRNVHRAFEKFSQPGQDQSRSADHNLIGDSQILETGGHDRV